MAFTASNPRKQLVIHWEDYDRTLPTDSSSLSKLRRRELFDEFDPAGNGILQQAAVVRALFRLFPRVAGILDTRPLLNLCFRVARDTSPPIVPISVASIDRNEFRSLLICLRCYLKLWEVWYNHTSGERRHDGLLRPEDADLFHQLLKQWNCADVNSVLVRLRSDITRLDSGKVGAVEFDKFADAALRRTLPYLTQEEEGAEVEEAQRLLKATHNHLFFKEAPVGPQFSGAVTLALGKGRNQGYNARSSASLPFDGSVTSYVKGKNKGWSADAHSQYVHDFAVPQYAALKQAAKSRFSLGRSESTPSLLPGSGLSAAGGLIASSPAKQVTFKLGKEAF